MCKICEAKDKAEAAEAELSFRLRQHLLELTAGDEVAATKVAETCRVLVNSVIIEQVNFMRLYNEHGRPKKRSSH